MKFQLHIKRLKEYKKINTFLALKLSDVAIILLMNVKMKMPTSVGILTFMSRVKLHEHEKSLITSGQVAVTIAMSHDNCF